MTQQIRVLVRGEREARTVYVTRILAFRLFCDCYRCTGSVAVKSSVFLVALDRDDLKSYIKHASEPESAPWEAQGSDAYHQLKAVGMKLARDEDSSPDHAAEPEPASASEGAARELAAAIPWWDRSDDEAEQANHRRELAALAARREWERKRSLGLVEPDDPAKPKESKYAEAKRKKEEARLAQLGIDLHVAGDDAPRDIDDRE